MKAKGNAIQCTEEEINHQDDQKVHQCRNISGENKQILGDIDLREDFGIAHKAIHAAPGRFLKISHHQITAEQIGGIERGIAAKELGKDHLHHQQCQQRRQNTPGHTQNGALVFFLEVAFDQFFKKELVLFYFLKHRSHFSFPHRKSVPTAAPVWIT